MGGLSANRNAQAPPRHHLAAGQAEEVGHFKQLVLDQDGEHGVVLLGRDQQQHCLVPATFGHQMLRMADAGVKRVGTLAKRISASYMMLQASSRGRAVLASSEASSQRS